MKKATSINQFISEQTGYSVVYVKQVRQGKRSNKLIEQAVRITETQSKLAAQKIKQEKAKLLNIKCQAA